MAKADEQLIDHSEHYEVQIQSNGSKFCGFAAGTWFQTGPLMQPFPTYALAEDAAGEFRAGGDYQFSHLPLRIVVIKTSSVAVKTIN